METLRRTRYLRPINSASYIKVNGWGLMNGSIESNDPVAKLEIINIVERREVGYVYNLALGEYESRMTDAK